MKTTLFLDVAKRHAGRQSDLGGRSLTPGERVSDVIGKHALRNDEQIVSDVKQSLHDCGYQQLRHVRVYCDHGRITLQGRVTTYYLKQVAQEVVRSVAHVRDVDNDLHVICPG